MSTETGRRIWDGELGVGGGWWVVGGGGRYGGGGRGRLCIPIDTLSPPE